MTNFNGISDRSAGPTPDALALKVSGTTELGEDFARGTEVEITLRGVVSGHAFDDKRDKNGNVVATVKYVKVAADELVEAKLIPSRNTPTGQITIEDALDEIAPPGTKVTIERPAGVDEDGVIAEVPSEIDPAAEGGDDEQDDPGEEPRAPAPIRHPQVTEESWAQLNHEQQRDVLAKVDKVERLAEYLSGVATPTDREVAEKRLDDVTGALRDTYGIELVPADQVREEDELVAPASEPPPPPVTEQSPPLKREQLERRRDYLNSKRALPPEMDEARQDELKEINRRLRAQGEAA